MLHTVTAGMVHVWAAIPNPGQGTAPPGGAKLMKIVSWVAWATFGICVIGVFVAAGKMAVAHHRGGGGGEHATSLGWVLAASVIAGSAAALVGAVT